MSKKLKNQVESKYKRYHVLLEKHQNNWVSRYKNRSEYVRQLIEKDIELSTEISYLVSSGQKD